MRRLLPAVLLCACQAPLVISTGSESLQVPEALTFPRTAVGSSRVSTIPLINRSRVAVTVTLINSGPFSAPAQVEIGGGDEVALDVTFSPGTAGHHAGTLEFDGFVVALDGEGVAPLDCGANTACHSRRFDAESLSCVDDVAANGTACVDANACIEGGRCTDGICTGVAARCDDGNACTTDSCAAGQGCVHSEMACASPANPCLAALCDPVRGCGTSPVVDGTPCGAVSCSLANVCLAGQCRAVEPPEGFPCSLETACRDEGRCRNKQCEIPAARTIRPRWTYRSTVDDFRFEGVTDDLGNWYWVECTPYDFKIEPPQASCQVVSRTQEGFERFRTNIGSIDLIARPSASRLQLLAGGHFIVGGGATLVATSITTGATVWRRQFPLEVLLTLADDGRGGVWLGARMEGETPSWSLRRLDAATGTPLAQSRAMPQPLQRLIVDELGRAYSAHYSGLLTADESATPVLVRVELDGGIGLNVSLPTRVGPVMVLSDRVVLDDDSAVSREDGGVLEPASAQMAWSRRGVAQSGVRARLAWLDPLIDVDPVIEVWPPRVWLERSDGRARSRPYSVIADDATSAYLTASNDVLFASQTSSAGHLRSVSFDGVEKLTCEIDGASALLMNGRTGYNGRFFAIESTCQTCLWAEPTVQFFDVGRLGTPSRGWVGPRGTLQGGSRPK